MTSLPTQPHRTVSDSELLARFRDGDIAAFSEIHRRFSPQLTRFARRILRDVAHDAEDVVQDAFLRAYTALRATDAPSALRPWLYTIVRNRALDELRRAHRLDGVLVEAHLAAPPTLDPAEHLTAREEVRRLVEEIGRLPERQRLALVMRECEGRSHAETARALQTSPLAVKSLIVRARTTLRSVTRAA